VVAAMLRESGLSAQVIENEAGGPPVIYGEDRGAGVDAPTVLFYNHYDVQPAEPLELWDSDPWTIRHDGDFLYGRGVSDDKGHIICKLVALDRLREKHNGKLPVNVKWLIEGEEEIASLHLAPWIEKHAALLSADVTLWEFGGTNTQGQPEMLCGLRGIATFELSVKTLAYDAHSGTGGGLYPNAAWRLVWALASLKDANERILIPGHYDSVIPPTETDLALLAKISPEGEVAQKETMEIAEFLGGVTGVDAHVQGTFLPTCTINGMGAGWQGEGSKTILPAEASAKLDFRLVPDMSPDVIATNLRAHLDAQGFTDIEIAYTGGQKPGRCDPDHPLVQLAAATAREIYGVEALILPLSPVTGPVHPFTNGLRQPIVTIGCGYPGARVHSPNENLRLSDFTKGVAHTVLFLESLGKQGATA
jgi:acetylornithine deacetylase/succinyl-diaminopimelate desuccinylase-like protein